MCSFAARAPVADCLTTTGAATGLVGVELVLLDELEHVLFVNVELESEDEFESFVADGCCGAFLVAVAAGALYKCLIISIAFL